MDKNTTTQQNQPNQIQIKHVQTTYQISEKQRTKLKADFDFYPDEFIELLWHKDNMFCGISNYRVFAGSTSPKSYHQTIMRYDIVYTRYHDVNNNSYLEFIKLNRKTDIFILPQVSACSYFCNYLNTKIMVRDFEEKETHVYEGQIDSPRKNTESALKLKPYYGEFENKIEK